MISDIGLRDRRHDYSKRVAVIEAVSLRRRGLLKEGMRLLLESEVPTPVIIRTLLSDDDSDCEVNQ